MISWGRVGRRRPPAPRATLRRRQHCRGGVPLAGLLLQVGLRAALLLLCRL